MIWSLNFWCFQAIKLCDPLTNNSDKVHHYWITVTPHTNFMVIFYLFIFFFGERNKVLTCLCCLHLRLHSVCHLIIFIISFYGRKSWAYRCVAEHLRLDITNIEKPINSIESVVFIQEHGQKSQCLEENPSDHWRSNQQLIEAFALETRCTLLFWDTV